MNKPPVALFCPSCTMTQFADPIEGEHYFATKNRIRLAMGQSCPRTTGRDKCPMRDRAAPMTIDGEIVR